MARAKMFDCLVVGGGVVGCSVSRLLQSLGARCAIIERNMYPLGRASGGNSGILCTGYDAPRGSMEALCLQIGRQSILRAVGSLSSVSLNTGALVMSGNNDMSSIYFNAVKEIESAKEVSMPLSAKLLQQLEPRLDSARFASNGAMYIDGEITVDSYHLASSWLSRAMLDGTELYLGHSVRSIEPCLAKPLGDSVLSDATSWKISTESSDGRSLTLRAHAVIMCGGNYSEALGGALSVPEGVLPESGPIQDDSIRDSLQAPRKGQYVVFRQQTATRSRNKNSRQTQASKYDPTQAGLYARAPISRPLQPLPTDHSKGVFVFPSACGRMLVAGPTAEDTIEQDRPSCSLSVAQSLVDHVNRLLPGVVGPSTGGGSPVAEDNHPRWVPWFTYAGLRPALRKRRDYRFSWLRNGRWESHSDGAIPDFGLSGAVPQDLESVNVNRSSGSLGMRPGLAPFLSIDGIRSTGLSASQGIAAMTGMWWLSVVHAMGSLDGKANLKAMRDRAETRRWKWGILQQGMAEFQRQMNTNREVRTPTNDAEALSWMKAFGRDLMSAADDASPPMPIETRTTDDVVQSIRIPPHESNDGDRRPGQGAPDGWPHLLSTGPQSNTHGGAPQIQWMDQGKVIGGERLALEFGQVQARFEGTVVTPKGSAQGAWLPVTHPLAAASALLSDAKGMEPFAAVSLVNFGRQ